MGRGLGALLSSVPEITPEERDVLPVDDGQSVGTICFIDIARVRRNPFQPRMDFNAQALDELKQSILENGVIQPITVRRVDGGFELISGERRVRASIEAGLTQIPAYILNVESDRAMMELALIENVQRENLNPIEVALGYQRLIRDLNLSQEDVAKKVGKDRSTVTNFIRLLKLPEQIQNSLRNNEIAMGHARALLTIPDDHARLEVWLKVCNDGLSVRRTESMAKQVAENAATHATKRSAAGAAPQSNERNGSRAQVEVMYNAIANRLQQVMGTQVRIKSGVAGDGAISIDFYSAEDLERLLDLFAVIERHGQ
ncbi:MAG: ParB/RepB/Spo0J family partition protein [Bacteroidetes bacterium]|nr:ParB/RepB/Spo0J family partition protein [Bacteroidota bacterium]